MVTPSPWLAPALFATLGAGLVALSAACVVLWRRVRALTPRPNPTPTVTIDLGLVPKAQGKARPELAGRVDELDAKLRAVEARLASVESRAQVPPSNPPRADAWPTLRADRSSAMAAGGPTLIAVPSLSTSGTAGPEVAAELDRRFGAIWSLADSGAATEDLARRTGYPIGQVELILGLRRQLLAAEGGPDA